MSAPWEWRTYCRAPINTIPRKVWERVIVDRKTLGWMEERYKQPDFCGYPEALAALGCWSLTSWPWTRTRKRCSKCDEFVNTKKPNG